MPDAVDIPEDKAHAAAVAIGDQVATLWKSAHTAGVREGLEVAAVITDTIATQIADNYEIPAEVRDFAAMLLRTNRDQMRLASLQVPDPELGS